MVGIIKYLPEQILLVLQMKDNEIDTPTIIEQVRVNFAGGGRLIPNASGVKYLWSQYHNHPRFIGRSQLGWEIPTYEDLNEDAKASRRKPKHPGLQNQRPGEGATTTTTATHAAFPSGENFSSWAVSRDPEVERILASPDFDWSALAADLAAQGSTGHRDQLGASGIPEALPLESDSGMGLLPEEEGCEGWEDYAYYFGESYSETVTQSAESPISLSNPPSYPFNLSSNANHSDFSNFSNPSYPSELSNNANPSDFSNYSNFSNPTYHSELSNNTNPSTFPTFSNPSNTLDHYRPTDYSYHSDSQPAMNNNWGFQHEYLDQTPTMTNAAQSLASTSAEQARLATNARKAARARTIYRARQVEKAKLQEKAKRAAKAASALRLENARKAAQAEKDERAARQARADEEMERRAKRAEGRGARW